MGLGWAGGSHSEFDTSFSFQGCEPCCPHRRLTLMRPFGNGINGINIYMREYCHMDNMGRTPNVGGAFAATAAFLQYSAAPLPAAPTTGPTPPPSISSSTAGQCCSCCYTAAFAAAATVSAPNPPLPLRPLPPPTALPNSQSASLGGALAATQTAGCCLYAILRCGVYALLLWHIMKWNTDASCSCCSCCCSCCYIIS
jgi:hypothetical protein